MIVFNKVVTTIITCFILTVIIEAVFAFILGVRTVRGQLTAFFANTVTNPLLNGILTVVSFYYGKYYYLFLIFLEISVIIAEGLIFNKILKLKINGFLLSLLLNIASYALGTAILNFIH